MIDLSHARWFTSTMSGNNGGCVEVAHVDRHVAVRDTKDRTLPPLVYTGEQWDRLLHGIRAGDTPYLRDGMVHLADPDDASSTPLAFTPFEWDCFADGVIKREFDRPQATEG